MKIHILRVFVLLVSISAASVLVWNATQDQKPKQTQEDSVITPKKMQGSSKMKVVITANIIETMDSESIVTDEEVKRTRDMMMSTSKSGRIMSDDKIREMLEEQKKEELKYKQKPPLMSSSKSSLPIFEPKDLEKMIEPEKRDPNAKQELPLQQDPFAPNEKNEK